MMQPAPPLDRSILPWYDEIWCWDFEFGAEPGERPDVRCMVALELRTGRVIRLWEDQLTSTPPFDLSKNVIVEPIAKFLGCRRTADSR